LIDNIKIVKAVQILDCKNTNSIPLQVLCEENEIYIIKTMFKKHPPFEDLINEILCNYFFQCWDIPVPEQALVIFDDILIEQYLHDNNSINKKYVDFKFENHYFYGSKFLPYSTEVDLYNIKLKDKHDYNKYQNPIDLIKIGVFDKWIANMDRRIDNPNILIDNTGVKFRFIPIDNTQSFGNQSDYKNLKLPIMDTVNNKSILNAPITKSISKFANSKKYSNLANEITNNIEKSIDLISLIFQNIPSEFGLSKEGKDKIKVILSNQTRNEVISRFYLNYSK
tara:strand:- start:1259 stop:2101 length:843 start_codon:yes stop_codon:yes gene_type:complete